MKKLLIIALLVVGCEAFGVFKHEHDETETEGEWNCVFHLHTDHPCINPNFSLEESTGTGGNPPNPPDSVTKITVFSSFDECKAICPDTLIVTSVPVVEMTTCYLMECLEISD